MNKITSTLAGLAIMAAATVAPAFADLGAFPPTTGGTFSTIGSSFKLLNVAPAKFFDFTSGTLYTGSASVVGGTPEAGHPDLYDNSTLIFTSGNFFLSDSGTASLAFSPGTVTVGSSKGFTDSFTFTSAVPEASTVASFGVLLALGSLAVLRRKSVKNAA